MLTVQHLFRPEGIVSDAKGQVPLQTAAQFVRTYNAQAHEITNAIKAVVINAHAILRSLRAPYRESWISKLSGQLLTPSRTSALISI